MAESCARFQAGQLGLVGIKFPGMRVEHRGAAVCADRLDGFERELQWEQAEVASSDGNVDPASRPRRGWELADRTMLGFDVMDLFGGVGQSVTVMAADRKDAAIDVEIVFSQDVQCPQGLFDNRKTGRSIRGDFDAAGVGDRFFAVRDVFGECFGREVVNQLMPIAVGCKFVTGVRNPTDQIGVTLGDPSEDEERGADVMLVKDRQQLVGVRFDTALVLVPVLPRNSIGERGDLKVVFDVNGEGVGDVGGKQGRWGQNVVAASRWGKDRKMLERGGGQKNRGQENGGKKIWGKKMWADC